MDDPSGAACGGIGGGAALRLVAPDGPARRLDKALAEAAPAGLSRARLTGLIRAGALRREDGGTVTDPARKVKAGEAFLLSAPAPEPAAAAPEPIPLVVVFEDEHAIVVDKPAGMVVHPAPGAWTGTLVNALLHHCGDSLSGVGGVRRPGIVHRIDKDTSGLLVAAKTDRAHHALAEAFAAHDIVRDYLAFVRGVPDRGDPRLMGTPGLSVDGDWLRYEARVGRHPRDRKRMAVARGAAGKRAVTRFRIEDRLTGGALLRCRLETGRTHQIRAHLAHLGHGLIGDQVYNRGGTKSLPEAAAAFPRQALHAARLGFRHPITKHFHEYVSILPPDLDRLRVSLQRN